MELCSQICSECADKAPDARMPKGHISSHTTAELAAELVRRGTSYAGNCTLTSWNNGPKGMTFGFKADTKDGEDIILHNHPFEGCYVGKDGDRFFVMAYPIPNDTPQEDTQIIADPHKRRYNELKYVERAGILASDTDFQVFARVKAGAVIWDSKIYYGYKTSELAAAYTQYEKDRILGHASGISGHYVFVPDEDMIKAINVLPDAAALGCKLCKISANKKGRDGKPKQKVKVLQ